MPEPWVPPKMVVVVKLKPALPPASIRPEPAAALAARTLPPMAVPVEPEI